MGFFDLNIPYHERDAATATASREAAGSVHKTGRLKAVVKAMELGYTGVAYNRNIRGVVSDVDRCKIPPFPLSSLLKAAPALAAAARFHRELLGVPRSSPFRQYSRLTVAVDSALGDAALNSGNAVLRTYHLVAVRPLNQIAFDQACQASEVDLIAIDFSQKLPFRLKLPVVKAAIKRGVYFEITYSHIISDADIRRKILSNAKLLVDWTRGKNIIFSSGASSVNEIRGPYDVVNLASLLGLSMERAKLAISRNCRSLLTNALRRKQCYKEAIRVEKISPTPNLDTTEPWFIDWSNWDPISSGEGDLPALDDIARSFSASGSASRSYSNINYETVTDGVLSHEIPCSEGVLSLDDGSLFFPVTNACEAPLAADEGPHQERLDVLAEDEMLLPATSFEYQFSGIEDHLAPSANFGKPLPGEKTSKHADTENEDPNLLKKFDVVHAADEEPSFDDLANTCNVANKSEVKSLDNSGDLFTVSENIMSSEVCVRNSDGPDSITVVLDTPGDATSPRDLFPGIENVVSPKDIEGPLGNLMEIDFSSFSTKDDGSLSELCSTESTDNVPEVQVLAKTNKPAKKNPFMSVYDILFQEDFAKSGMTREDDRVLFPVDTKFNEASDRCMQTQRETVSVVDVVPSKEILVNLGQHEDVSAAMVSSRWKELKLGKIRLKRRLTRGGLPFLSKHFLLHLPFKKKIQHSKGSRKKYVRTKRDRKF